MNANELADKQAFETGELTMWIRNETATMLRQQQAEIEALKADTIPYKDLHRVVKNVLAHPVKELHLSLQKSKQTGELLAVTYTDDEHRIVEVLWQRPPELTDEEILEVWRENERVYPMDRSRLLDRTRACIRKALAK
jgi:hypothetical protein